MATTQKKTSTSTTTNKSTNASTAKKSTGTTKSTTKKQTPRLYEREPRTVAQETGYAVAALAADTVGRVRELPHRVATLRHDAPAAVKESPERARTVATDLRDTATKRLDSRLKRFEKTFDKKARAGRKVTRDLQKDERFSAVESQVRRVLDQTTNTRSQVKAAVTSVRKTATVATRAGVDAGRKQADNAKTQVKGATTSAQKSASTAADASKQVAS